MAWRLEPFKPAIDAMQTEDTTAPRRQRPRRAQIDVEAGRRVEVFVPQEYAPGARAQVDFDELCGALNGEKAKGRMFVFRLLHSGKAIHWIRPTQALEAFLEG